MSIKKTLIVGLLTAGMGVSFVAEAADLTITNYSRRDSTVIADRGACSTILGSVGITKAGSPDKPTVNTVPDSKVKLACGPSIRAKTDCQADVYMTNNCSGPVVATVFFDYNNGTGIKLDKSTVNDKSYSIKDSVGFNVIIKGGPAAVAKK